MQEQSTRRSCMEEIADAAGSSSQSSSRCRSAAFFHCLFPCSRKHDALRGGAGALGERATSEGISRSCVCRRPRARAHAADLPCVFMGGKRKEW